MAVQTEDSEIKCSASTNFSKSEKQIHIAFSRSVDIMNGQKTEEQLLIH
jgi:hypothetical protein